MFRLWWHLQYCHLLSDILIVLFFYSKFLLYLKYIYPIELKQCDIWSWQFMISFRIHIVEHTRCSAWFPPACVTPPLHIHCCLSPAKPLLSGCQGGPMSPWQLRGPRGCWSWCCRRTGNSPKRSLLPAPCKLGIKQGCKKNVNSACSPQTYVFFHPWIIIMGKYFK